MLLTAALSRVWVDERVKVKFTLEQTMKAQAGSRGTASLFLQPRHYMGCVGNATPRRLYPRERNPVPIEQGAGWAPESVWTGAEILAPCWDSIPVASSS
jgi:hypothetical protein